MLQVVRVIFSVLAAALIAGCDTIDIKGFVAPTSESVNNRFDKSMTLTESKAVATVTTEESYLFYVCADPHIDSTFDNLRLFATQLRNDQDARFGIVLGDCADRRKILPNYIEAIAYVEDTQATDTQIFSILGNHDLYFDGWNNFYAMLGASVYWFDAEFGSGRDLFIALDSASGTLGSRQLKWLRGFLAAERSKYRHCVVLTHTNLFYTDNSQTGSGNMALEESAAIVDLFSRHDVTLCLQGHDHYREDLTLGGVRYTIVGTIRDEAKKPEYLKIRLSNAGVGYNWVNIE